MDRITLFMMYSVWAKPLKRSSERGYVQRAVAHQEKKIPAGLCGYDTWPRSDRTPSREADCRAVFVTC